MPKRILIDDPTAAESHWPRKQQKRRVSKEEQDGAAARLLTTALEDGRVHSILVAVDRPVVIGRKPTCHFTIPSPVISMEHCKITAFVSFSNDSCITLCCQDLSTNGLTWNDQPLRPKSNLLLMHGDVLMLPNNQQFKVLYKHAPKAPRKKDPFGPSPSNQEKRCILAGGRYIVTSTELGHGAFATVNLAVDIVEREQVACKALTPKGEKQLERVRKEVDILRDLDHPNINKILDVYESECGSWIYLFLALSTGGDLFSHQLRRGRLNEMESKYFLFQLLMGLEYLHRAGVAHRDLKPENILLLTPPPFPRLLIADFGLAKVIPPTGARGAFSLCGTLEYLAPEYVWSMDCPRDGLLSEVGAMPGDCWALGCIGYQMLTGYHPFYPYDQDVEETPQPEESEPSTQPETYSPSCDASQPEPSDEQEEKKDNKDKPMWTTKKDLALKDCILEGKPDYTDDASVVLAGAKTMIAGLLVKDARKRWTAGQAFACRWIQSSRDSLEVVYRKTFVGSV